MRIPRLFVEQSLASGDLVSLPKDKAHYVTHVLRMNTGAQLKLFNNTNSEFEGIIKSITKKSAEIEIKRVDVCHTESTLEITLCLAVSRGQHMDYSLQKAVELGVHRIVPVLSEFSNVKIQPDRLQNKMSHWQNILISAAEQCGRCCLPELSTPVLFQDCLLMDIPKPTLIFHPESNQSMQKIDLMSKKLSLLIGPEGGFSKEEINIAQQNETISVKLGPRILRAETAVVTAISNAQQLWGDLK